MPQTDIFLVQKNDVRAATVLYVQSRSRGNVRFLAVGGVEDGTLVAYYTHSAQPRASKLVKSCLDILEGENGKIASRMTTSVPEVGSIHYAQQSDFLFFGVTASGYPPRTAFQMLEETASQLFPAFEKQMRAATSGALNRDFHKLFQQIASKYDDVGAVEKIVGVQAQVDDVKEIMQENVKQILQTQEKIEQIADKTDSLRDSANAFKKGSTQMRKSMWWKLRKMQALIALIIIAILCAVIVPILT